MVCLATWRPGGGRLQMLCSYPPTVALYVLHFGSSEPTRVNEAPPRAPAPAALRNSLHPSLHCP